MRSNVPQRIKNDKRPLHLTHHRSYSSHPIGDSLQNVLTNEEIRPHHPSKQAQPAQHPIIHHQQTIYPLRRHPKLHIIILGAELQIYRSYHAKYEDARLKRKRHQEVALRAG